MKRIIILISVLLLVSFALNDANAQKQKNLDQVISDGDIDQLKSRISDGENVNTKSNMGWTLLHTAIHYSQTEIIQLLIEKGADVNASDKLGRTPLHLAVKTGQKKVVELLISKGAEINAIDRESENALSIAKKNKQDEIAELLEKNGAKKNNMNDLYGEGYYQPPGGESNANNRITQAQTGKEDLEKSNIIESLLADPNEINKRIKTFDGLEKALKEVSEKSKNEERQWLLSRHDNRTMLLRYADKQFEDEIDLIRKIAVAESAKNTVKTIDSMRTERKKRSLKINRELIAQKREKREAELTSIRGRGRPSGRSMRSGRTTMRGLESETDTIDPMYEGGAISSPRGQELKNDIRLTEQLDPQKQEQMRLWLQADPDNKLELARGVYPQIHAEIGPIRAIAVEEKAQKTTAAIDGILLARKERFDGLVTKMEQEQEKQQAQNQRYGNAEPGLENQQNSRYSARTRRGTSTQENNQQQSTRRGRRR